MQCSYYQVTDEKFLGIRLNSLPAYSVNQGRIMFVMANKICVNGNHKFHQIIYFRFSHSYLTPFSVLHCVRA